MKQSRVNEHEKLPRSKEETQRTTLTPQLARPCQYPALYSFTEWQSFGTHDLPMPAGTLPPALLCAQIQKLVMAHPCQYGMIVPSCKDSDFI